MMQDDWITRILSQARYKNIIAMLLIVGVALLFFFSVTFSNYTFGYGDLHRYFYPLRFYVASCIKSGILPLWNPYLFSGYPCFAALQLGIFYPVSILVYILPFHLGFNLYIVSHFLLSGIFMYLLMREWKTGFTGSIISALSYALGGYMLSVVDMLTTLSAAAWTPLIFLFYTKALAARKDAMEQKHKRHRGMTQGFRYTILTGITLGIAFLGGEPSVWYMVSMALGLYAIYSLPGHEGAVRTFILSFLISIAFFLPQMLPLLELIFYSTRSNGMELSQVISFSLKPCEVFNLICPFFTGNYVDKNHFWFGQSWLESIYLGILPFLLAMFAIFTGTKRFWSLLLLLFLLIATGSIYQFLYQYLPGFNLIRYPVKFFSIAAFALSILAGFGYESMNKHRKWFGRLIVVFMLGYLAVYLSCWLFSPKFIPWIAANWHTTTTIDRLTIWYNATLSHAGIVLIVLFISTIAMFLYWKGMIQSWVFSLAIIAMVIFDLFLANEKINPVFDSRLYSHTSSAAAFLKQDTTCFRMYMEPETEKYYRIIRGKSLDEALKSVQDTLVPNATLFYNLFAAWGYESININDYSRVIDMINHPPKRQSAGLYHLLDMLNIKYILSCFQVQNPGFKHIYNDEKINIYANPDYLPRAFMVPECMVIKDRARILEKLMDIDPGQVVVLEAGEPLAVSSQQLAGVTKVAEVAEKVRIVQYQPNTVLIQADTARGGFLFLSDTYYPGWSARVDGVKTRIYRANYAFRAIYLKPGSHRVEFRYMPDSLLIGCWASLIAILLCIASGWCLARVASTINCRIG
ncbi:MAG: YfhO family protein [bacterium]|nr:YfhO family protein [bacterium]